MTTPTVPARLSELRNELTELKTRIGEASRAENPDDATRDALAADLARWDEINDGEEFRELEERQAKVERVAAASVKPGAVEPTEDRSFNVNSGADPFDLGEVRSLANRITDGPDGRLTAEGRKAARDMVARAQTAIERQESRFVDSDHAEAATQFVKRDGKGTLARWVLEHGSDDYHEAFQDFMANPAGGPTQGQSARAAMSLTGANGGYLVPFTLDPSVILTNNGATDPFRSISRVVSITTDDWNGVSSAGVTAEWIAEATEVADASPTFGQPTITAHKADAYIQGSLEVVADASLSGEIAMLIADAKGRLEATAHATGSGSGQPYGIVTALGLTTASRVAGSSGAAGAADFVLADVYAVKNALPPRYRPNASWVGEQTNIDKIRRFGEGSTGAAAFWADLAVDTPPLLLGKPVYESSAMDSTIVSGSNDDVLIIGDFRHGFVLVDRMGLELVYNPLVLGSNRRPSGEVAWVAFWRHGADSVDDNAFRMLRL